MPDNVPHKKNWLLSLLARLSNYKRTKEALRESEERFNSLFLQTGVGVAVIDSETGRFLRVNQKYADIAKLSPAQMLKTTFMKITHADDLAADLKNMDQLKHGLIPEFTMEKRYRYKNGSAGWVSLAVSPLSMGGRNLKQHLALVTDINAQKQSEIALSAANQRAENFARSKAKFLDIAAHELRTPITVFSAMTQLAQKQLAKGKPLDAKGLARLQEAGDRLGRLVFDILDVSQLEKGLITLRPAPKNLVSLLEQCLEDFRLVFPKRKFIFQRPDQPIEMEVDPIRMYQVLSNMIDNALKYSPEDSPIEIGIEARPKAVRISVIDHGTSIPKEQQERLFIPFSRGEADQIAGLGLGLAISQEIIRLHGGVLRADPQTEKGNVFYFEIPRRDSSFRERDAEKAS